MENAKHIGCMWAAAVALGIGMAVAATPAVASADKGSESGDSSSSSSEDSGSTSSEPSSKKSESSATNDGPDNQRRATDTSDAESSTADDEDDSASDSAPEKTDPETEVDATDDDSAVEPESSTTNEQPASAPRSPASIVSTVINGVLSPFAPSAPDEPVEQPAASALLTLSRRDVEPGSSTPSTAVDPPVAQVTNGLVTDSAATSSEEDVSVAVEPDFVSSTRGFFGLFSITSAGDPSDNNYVAVVFETPIFTIVLTSGTDPEDNLGFGAPSIGVAGQTVATFILPFVTFSAGIPIEDPFAELFIDLIRAGIV
jgi:hypothetical protein